MHSTRDRFSKKSLALVLLISLSLWTTTAFPQIIKGTYAIKNVQTGLLLRVQDAQKANGTPIVSYSPVNWKCVTWDFQHVADDTYQLRNLFTRKTLQPVLVNPVAGGKMEQQPLVVSQETQEYEFIAAGNDTYRIKLSGTNLYITAGGGINSAVILAKKTAGLSQSWTIYEQHPTM